MKDGYLTRQFYLSDLTKLNYKTDNSEIMNIIRYLVTTQKGSIESLISVLEKKMKYTNTPSCQIAFIGFKREIENSLGKQ